MKKNKGNGIRKKDKKYTKPLIKKVFSEPEMKEEGNFLNVVKTTTACSYCAYGCYYG